MKDDKNDFKHLGKEVNKVVDQYIKSGKKTKVSKKPTSITGVRG